MKQRKLFTHSKKINTLDRVVILPELSRPRNFAEFTGKHLLQSLYFNKVAGLRPQACNFIKIETLAQVFSCEVWWLLLK